MVYEPREDSYLLLSHVKQYAKGRVLDMGCGSGILGIEASKYAREVVCADIDEFASVVFRKNSGGIRNVKFVCSDLFSDIQGKFDLIVINPPYLPEDVEEDDASRLATTGGKVGYEFIEQFLDDAKNYLKKDGKILMCFSSLSYKDKIDDILVRTNYKFEKIDEKKLFYEELYIYLIYVQQC